MAEVAAWLVIDAETGRTFQSNNAGRPWFPASLTKLMTAYVTFKEVERGQISLLSPVKISARARREPPSKMGLPVGTRLTIDAALKLILVKSANDISVALSEAVGGSHDEFISLMNVYSDRLGMRDTFWTNPHGLPSKLQLTTARDISVLARALWTEFPQHRDYFSIRSIRALGRILTNHNTLLDHVPTVNGMKTGYICASGFNLAAASNRFGQSRIAIVLGAGSSLERAVISKQLLDKSYPSTLGFLQFSSAADSGRNLPPPSDQYCNMKKHKVSPAEFLKIYGTKSLIGRSLLVEARLSESKIDGLTNQERRRQRRVIRRQHDKFWEEIKTALLGPKLPLTSPIRVRLGAPSEDTLRLVTLLPNSKPSHTERILSEAVEVNQIASLGFFPIPKEKRLNLEKVNQPRSAVQHTATRDTTSELDSQIQPGETTVRAVSLAVEREAEEPEKTGSLQLSNFPMPKPEVSETLKILLEKQQRRFSKQTIQFYIRLKPKTKPRWRSLYKSSANRANQVAEIDR